LKYFIFSYIEIKCYNRRALQRTNDADVVSFILQII